MENTKHYNGTPRDTQPLRNFQIRSAVHTALGQSFHWMLTKRTLWCVSQNASLGGSVHFRPSLPTSSSCQQIS